MEAYKFQTTIQEDGIIQIPRIAKWVNQQVEVFIVLGPENPPEPSPTPVPSIITFLKKWHGFLKEFDPEQLKAEYLQEKYG
ncbi:MAG: hypothetical protein KC418_04565 [Anaerolineales bacterium]|nr:hypothetical protein [Anaerolineales bacterium]